MQQPGEDLQAHAEAAEFTEDDAGEEAPETGAEAHPAEGQHPPRSEEGGDKRRRRRRRGRRGRHREGSSDVANAPQNIAASGDRFGDSGSPPPADIPGATAAENEPDLTAAGFGIAPNTPSTPHWSLTAEEPAEPQPQQPSARSRAESSAEPGREPQDSYVSSQSETAAARGQEQARSEAGAETASEARRGWWQRRFKA
jgi:ribonuclease E